MRLQLGYTGIMRLYRAHIVVVENKMETVILLGTIWGWYRDLVYVYLFIQQEAVWIPIRFECRHQKEKAPPKTSFKTPKVKVQGG